MLPFGVTIPATVPKRSQIPEGLMNYPVYRLSTANIIRKMPFRKIKAPFLRTIYALAEVYSSMNFVKPSSIHDYHRPLEGLPRHPKKMYRNETNCYDTNYKFSAIWQTVTESAHCHGYISVNYASVHRPTLFLYSSSVVVSNEGLETRARIESVHLAFWGCV